MWQWWTDDEHLQEELQPLTYQNVDRAEYLEGYWVYAQDSFDLVK